MIPDEELISQIEALRNLMIAVATGGPPIRDVDAEYKQLRGEVHQELLLRGLPEPNPHSDLWAWYGRWSAGDLPSYASRRAFMAEMYEPLLDLLRGGLRATASRLFDEPTGWQRVDRCVYELRMRLERGETEEQFQAIGLYCREVLVTLAQEVWEPSYHPTPDGVSPSQTDAKRMLDAYVLATLPGRANEAARKHAKAAVDLANELQHRRTADYRLAAICAEATASVVNLVAIISGRRDRKL